MGNSSPIISNQQGIHRDLLTVVGKYTNSYFAKPVAEHTATAFAKLNNIVRAQGKPVIIDSGCGTGESSFHLAAKYPDNLVIGIDKSAARIAKSSLNTDHNVLLIRAELVDMWRLMETHKWLIDAHFIFYPNPWPKKQHLKRRWQGHPIFLPMLRLSRSLEVRTNWALYALEFETAVKYLIDLGLIKGHVSMTSFTAQEPISLFEKKYAASGHPLFQIQYRVDGKALDEESAPMKVR